MVRLPTRTRTLSFLETTSGLMSGNTRLFQHQMLKSVISMTRGT